ncbi:hypothetical protein BV22DRAFT_1048223 [Leucogyrophana mollusca]|uniref:Uncharacterized protein n=1 Tax=Leucogyrophana mollusca TaxID=85980 RepID=A0ACB8BCM3_9AGAM|nr:hypothetical protein BV22DRAFT_1048223 [Leucogyrophana mollusca]
MSSGIIPQPPVDLHHECPDPDRRLDVKLYIYPGPPIHWAIAWNVGSLHDTQYHRMLELDGVYYWGAITRSGGISTMTCRKILISQMSLRKREALSGIAFKTGVPATRSGGNPPDIQWVLDVLTEAHSQNLLNRAALNVATLEASISRRGRMLGNDAITNAWGHQWYRGAPQRPRWRYS